MYGVEAHLKANLKRLVSVFFLFLWKHTAAVKAPPLQEIAGVRRSLLQVPLHSPLIRVEGVAPRLRLSQEVHHLGVCAIPGQWRWLKVNEAFVGFKLHLTTVELMLSTRACHCHNSEKKPTFRGKKTLLNPEDLEQLYFRFDFTNKEMRNLVHQWIPIRIKTYIL